MPICSQIAPSEHENNANNNPSVHFRLAGQSRKQESVAVACANSPSWVHKVDALQYIELSTHQSIALSLTAKHTTNLEMEHQTVHQIEQNDPRLRNLVISTHYDSRMVDFARLCDGLRRNTNVQSVEINGSLDLGNSTREFVDGVLCSNSISDLRFKNCNLSEGVAQALLQGSGSNCDFNKMEKVTVLRCHVANIGASVLTSSLVRCSALKQLSLQMCNMHDETIRNLVSALKGHKQLQVLDLSNNNIGNLGCKSLATLLQDPSSSLCTLALDRNSIGNKGAIHLANALKSNTKLAELHLDNNHDIKRDGWDAFAQILCNTTNINSTYMSNHTLLEVEEFGSEVLPKDLSNLLILNSSSDDTRGIAMKKILQHHEHFDMQPFFEWEIKVLPHAVKWIDDAKTSVCEEDDGGSIDARMLSVIFQYAQAMPVLFIPHNSINK